MNGFWLLVPFLLIRFGLPALLDRDAVRRAARFAPVSGGEDYRRYMERVRRYI